MNSLKQILILCITAISAFVLLISCDTTSSTDYEPVIVTGQVVDNQQNPLENAIVRIINPLPEIVTTTNAIGNFSLQLQVDSTINYTLEIRKEGFTTRTQDFLAIPERDINLPVIRLSTTNDDNGVDPTDPGEGSEGSAFITLQSLSETNIQVRETGGIETAVFEFIVTDSTGSPVSADNAVMVSFDIASGPDGGESIYPESIQTANGIAKAALTSGTVAGVVQIRASFTRDGNTMQSKPVSITISGGLPADNHFEANAAKRNIPASSSEINEITVLLGDKYGNTVPEGTAVYFSTNKGAINGSGSTNADGFASSQLKTNNTSPGIATVRIETVDENSSRIFRELNITFSGKPGLSVTPETLVLDNFQKETFSVVLDDENGNPLAEGTTLSVTMTHPELILEGQTQVTLSDNTESGEGSTEFEFILKNSSGQLITEDVKITLNVSGPNGDIMRELNFEAPEPPLAEAASIYLESVSETDLGVQSTGQNETSRLTFIVLDKNGNPLQLENSVDVNFRFGQAPGGGEYITDQTVTTDANGRAVATIISGTVAGTVQVIAEFSGPDGTVIRTSQPVKLVIHAGLPSQAHFSVVTESNNVPMIFGEEIEFNALVGDRYGNRVPDGTAIYFTTDAGYIQGSGYTVNGRAAATLTIGNPMPSDGIATITATTADNDQQQILATKNIVISGSPIITVTPESFDLENAEDLQFIYTVADANGNPMAEGTTIRVTVEGDAINVLGDVDITVGELNNSFSNIDELTNYSFVIDDANPDEINDTPVQITIEVSGPNGTSRRSIAGRKAKIVY